MAQSVIEVYKLVTSGEDGGHVDGDIHLKYSGTGITLCGLAVKTVCTYVWDGAYSYIWHPVADEDTDLSACERCLTASTGRNLRVISRPQRSCRTEGISSWVTDADVPKVVDAIVGIIVTQALRTAGYVTIPLAVLQDVQDRADRINAASDQDMDGKLYAERPFVTALQAEIRSMVGPILPYLSKDVTRPEPIPTPPLPVTVAEGAHNRLMLTITFLRTLLDRSPNIHPNETEYRIVCDGIMEVMAQLQRIATPLRQYVEARTGPKNAETGL